MRPLALRAVLGGDPFVLEWDDAVGCADASAVLTRVRAVVGEELARGELRAAIHARGRVRAIPRGLELTLVVATPPLERRIEAPDCAGIVEAAAVVLATSAVPQPLPPSPPPPTCDPPTPAPVCPSPPPPAAAPPVAPPQRPRPRALLSAHAVLGLATIDAVAPGLEIRLGAAYRDARVELGVRHLFAQYVATPEADAGARVSATVAELRGCWAPTAGRVTVPLCAAIAAGALQATGSGALADKRVARRLTLAAGPSVGVRVGITRRLALAADALLSVPLVRPGFRIDGADGELARVPPVGASFSLGAEVRLP
jgi:hypothetical protein